MKVIVTGVAGFIGTNLAAKLLQRGETVVGIDNLSRPGSVENLKFLSRLDGELECVHADIRCRSDLDRVFGIHTDAGAVIHEAAQVAVTTSVTDPQTDFEINALGTFNVLEAVRRYIPDAAFLYASTNKVYGKMESVTVREAPLRYQYEAKPLGINENETIDFHSPYGCSKGCAEQYVRDYHRIFGLKSVVFRQSCIYGPRQFGVEDQGWVAWFTIASVLGEPITIYGDGKQIRDLLWIDDLIELYLRAIERIDVAAGQIYNAGGGAENTLSLLELIAMLSESLSRMISPCFSDWRPGDQKVFIADCTKAEHELGWRPKVAPREGVARLLNWVQSSRGLFTARRLVCVGA